MPTSPKNPKVDRYIARNERWEKELAKLRTIVLSTGLTEDLKWGVPCYTLEEDDRNIVLLHCFKEYCAMLFTKGALMKDPESLLIQQTKNVQSARQIRFTSVKEVTAIQDILKEYLRDAIEVERSGAKVQKKQTQEFEMPEELENRLQADSKFKDAFYKLTPGRQRGYILHFSAAKQSKTRDSRIEKCIPLIVQGKGWNE